MDVDEWTHELLHNACQVIMRYEDHLRTKDRIGEAKALAKAMRELKETIPEEVMEVMRG